jgi:hypothetical protein
MEEAPALILAPLINTDALSVMTKALGDCH